MSERHGEGQQKTIEYRTWSGMRERCNNPNNSKYYLYGGRGIKVCEHWNDYRNFLADMGRRPVDKDSIDRIDSDGDYAPSNCRWATWKEQAESRHYDRGSKTPWAKLTEGDVLDIRSSTKTQVTLAAEYGVTQAAISAIKTRKNWAWL